MNNSAIYKLSFASLLILSSICIFIVFQIMSMQEELSVKNETYRVQSSGIINDLDQPSDELARIVVEYTSLQNKQTQYLWYAIFSLIILTCIAVIVFAYVRMKFNAMAGDIEAGIKKLEQMERVDDLVGTGNRRAFMAFLKREVNRSNRYGQSLSLLVLDVDNFKLFKDIYGHLVGNKVLKLIGYASQRSIRNTDLLARIADEEFALILPVTTDTSAEFVAERIRKTVEQATLEYKTEELHVTISIGVTQFIKGESTDDFLKRCLIAAYKAKKNGSNQSSLL